MDSMPFVDRLWFGEGHHYSGPPPEHFLVEISGIPFGLMGEMLEGGGNPWLGLVHGCTGRLGWGGNPSEVWQLWDAFGVQDAEFIGWWAEEECPVRSADPMVKATVWKKQDATLVALAIFSREARPAALLEPDKLPLLKPFAGAVCIIDEKQHPIEPSAAVEAPGGVNRSPVNWTGRGRRLSHHGRRKQAGLMPRLRMESFSQRACLSVASLTRRFRRSERTSLAGWRGRWAAMGAWACDDLA